ncbi:hypothetical protein [Dictyobacter aurantiacus]|uniref:Lipoprotein n=1 Tax=Dictyobacter aurantiacus TaxID=1936993 RepID=A0A401ZMU1_9CHLR|nr:hypothetical protein [Dictyobacter aurantiacus]GCE08178.1 hypothetical protein KDAU_55070 [Dictyobacter aurantiacus]
MKQYRQLSLMSSFVALALMTMLVACGNATAATQPGSTSVKTTPPLSVPSLQKTDWANIIPGKELGCPAPVSSGDPHGIQVDAKQLADVTGDGKPEAFVAVACVGSTESWPDHLEVFDGASDPAHPRRITTLLNDQDGTDGSHGFGLRVQSIKVSGKLVTVVSKGWLPGECFACGDQQVTDTFTWNGTRFIRGPRSVVRMA